MIKHGYGYGMNKWMDILSVDAIAPEKGLYMFACKGGHYYVHHEFYPLQKGERLFRYFEEEHRHSDNNFPVIPVAFHYVTEYSSQFVVKDWYEFDINATIHIYGFVVFALEEKMIPGKIHYAVSRIDKELKYKGILWKDYFMDNNNIIQAGNCSFDISGERSIKGNHREFNMSDINIMAYSCIFPCNYKY